MKPLHESVWLVACGCMWILLLHRQIPNSSAVVLPSLKSPPPGHGDCALQERPRPHRRRRSPWDRSTRLAEAFASEGRRSGRTRRLRHLSGVPRDFHISLGKDVDCGNNRTHFVDGFLDESGRIWGI